MERVDPRIAQTRRAVLTAALRLIAERGFAGATIEGVAELSGVARSTIYRRWPDPERLFIDCFEPMTEFAFVPPTGDVRSDLRRYLREYAARLNDPVYLAAFLALVDRAARDEGWAAAHRAVVNEASSRAAAILRAGVDRGTVRADLDVARAVEAVLSPFLYTRMVRFETITPAMEDRVLADLIERFGAAGTSMSRRGTRSLSPVPRAE